MVSKFLMWQIYIKYFKTANKIYNFYKNIKFFLKIAIFGFAKSEFLRKSSIWNYLKSQN